LISLGTPMIIVCSRVWGRWAVKRKDFVFQR